MAKIEIWNHPAGYGWFINRNGLQDCDAGYFKTEALARAYAKRPKLTFDEALQAIADERSVSHDDVQARALQRYVWLAEWHLPGCLSESRDVCLTKSEAIESALSMAEDENGAPRGMRADLIRYGMSDKVSPDAYVSMAITTVSRVRLSNCL